MFVEQTRQYCTRILRAFVPVALILLTLAAGTAYAGGPAAESVGGKVSQIGDVQVLQVWGTPQQRG